MFVPVESFEIIADELFIETGLAAASLILVGGPEAGGIRGEDFVDQEQLAIEQTEFEFGISDDDAALAGVFAGERVDFHARGAGLLGDIAADEFHGLGEGNIFIMTRLGLGGRCENRFRQFRRFLQPPWKFDATDRLPLAVFLPTRTGEVTAHDAFDGEGLRFFDDHAASCELGREQFAGSVGKGSLAWDSRWLG